jgi:hypothetical protein
MKVILSVFAAAVTAAVVKTKDDREKKKEAKLATNPTSYSFGPHSGPEDPPPKYQA